VCFDEHTLADLANRVGAGPGTSYTIMAACPGNPLLARTDLDDALDRLTDAGQHLVPAMLDDIANENGEQGTQLAVAGPAGWSDAS
jgi:hypothetical protein